VNAVAFVTASAHFGAAARRAPLPPLDSPDLWPTVVELAIKHGVGPLVWEALSRSPEVAVPPPARDSLVAQVMRSSATRLLCEKTLADAVRILRARGIEVIVLKGPTVAHSVYPRPELRLYHDLDLLCRVSDYHELRRVLVESGYTSAGTHESRGTHEELARKPSASESHSVRAFFDPSGDAKLEIHFDAMQLGLVDRHAEDFWRQSRTRVIGGVEIRELAPEHQFLHLALHAHRHCYSRLSWLVELDVLVRRGLDSMDWDRVVEVARGEGIGTALRHALLTLRAVLGTPMPRLPPPTAEERCLGVLYAALWPLAKTRRLDQREFRRLLHFVPDSADARQILYGLVLVGRRREKLQAVWQRRSSLLHRPAAP
jgi:hypothetical protein